jgi:predicted DNA-binding transcriptional regulator AlpA
MHVQSAIPHRIRVSDDVRYLTIGQVRERFGVSAMWVYRYMRDHRFPKPVRFGGKTSARHWLLSEIEEWERDRAKRYERAAGIPAAVPKGKSLKQGTDNALPSR